MSNLSTFFYQYRREAEKTTVESSSSYKLWYCMLFLIELKVNRLHLAYVIRQTNHSVRWVKQLNLFQKNNTQKEIIITRVYLLLLAGTLSTFVLEY